MINILFDYRGYYKGRERGVEKEGERDQLLQGKTWGEREGEGECAHSRVREDT